jgi:hypothetical protein
MPLAPTAGRRLQELRLPGVVGPSRWRPQRASVLSSPGVSIRQVLPIIGPEAVAHRVRGRSSALRLAPDHGRQDGLHEADLTQKLTTVEGPSASRATGRQTPPGGPASAAGPGRSAASLPRSAGPERSRRRTIGLAMGSSSTTIRTGGSRPRAGTPRRAQPRGSCSPGVRHLPHRCLRLPLRPSRVGPPSALHVPLRPAIRRRPGPRCRHPQDIRRARVTRAAAGCRSDGAPESSDREQPLQDMRSPPEDCRTADEPAGHAAVNPDAESGRLRLGRGVRRGGSPMAILGLAGGREKNSHRPHFFLAFAEKRSIRQIKFSPARCGDERG